MISNVQNHENQDRESELVRVREGTEISNSLGAMMARGLDMIMKFLLLLGGGPPSLVYVEYVL